MADSSHWNLNRSVFQRIRKALWTLNIDLVALSIPHQVPAYIAWELDPFSERANTFQHSWKNLKGYAFLSLSLIGRVPKKIQLGNATTACNNPNTTGSAMVFKEIPNEQLLPKSNSQGKIFFWLQNLKKHQLMRS